MQVNAGELFKWYMNNRSSRIKTGSKAYTVWIKCPVKDWKGALDKCCSDRLIFEMANKCVKDMYYLSKNTLKWILFYSVYIFFTSLLSQISQMASLFELYQRMILLRGLLRAYQPSLALRNSYGSTRCKFLNLRETDHRIQQQDSLEKYVAWFPWRPQTTTPTLWAPFTFSF